MAKRRIWMPMVLAIPLLAVAGVAGAAVKDGLQNVTCPDTAGRGDTITVTAHFTNRSTTPLHVTRGAMAMHIGNSAVSGPFAFSVPAATVVPALSFTNLGFPVPGTLELPVTVRIPGTVRLRTMITIGLGFFGAYSGEVGRHMVGRQEGCFVEITP